MAKRKDELTEKSFSSKAPNWCPGCGDFGIWTALKKALVRLGKRPDEIVIVFGIGCGGNMVNFIQAYGFHGLHGRPLPVAEGIRLANHNLPVIVIGGDGDGLGEGMGHFIHTIRDNPNITYVIHDNQVYGLTKGQPSPTAPRGFVSATAPEGVVEEPVNPIALALASGATFVSRGFAGDVFGLEELIVEAMNHPGFSIVDVLQPCVTYNHHNTYFWYYQRVYNLVDVHHDPRDFAAAWKKAHEPFDEKIPLGMFFRRERPTLESQQPALRVKRRGRHATLRRAQTLVASSPNSPPVINELLKHYQ